MAEVAPVVLSASLTKKQNGGVLSMLASIVLRATRLEDDAGQLTAARRTFKNAAPIIALMTSPGMIGRVRPTAARLHYEMGVREMRGGELARARTHMDAAARLSRSQDALTRVEPMLESLSALAAIDRQRGDAPSAQAALAKIIALARKMGDVGTEAEALVTSFEIHRDVGAAEEASKSLRAALTRALDARRLANTDPERARSELTLARVLEHYGKPEAARRATQRAYEASRADVQRFAHTIVHAARRALTLGDLRSAREAVQRALDARLPDDDMIYVALWLQLLEKKLSIPSDGTAEEAYAAIESSEGWPAKLRAWGRGKLNDKELLEAAKDRTQRTEAIFYSAMANHVAGKSDHALPKLREVVKSEAVDLVEVTIARDLLAEQNGALRLSLPPGVELP
jgi:tetratricopeptide (TPR) repeat protein